MNNISKRMHGGAMAFKIVQAIMIKIMGFLYVQAESSRRL